jgi:hypothetical protein
MRTASAAQPTLRAIAPLIFVLASI